MRLAALALVVLAAPALAQGWDEGVAALVHVDAFERPGDAGVWTDMRPVWFKGSDEELAALAGATLYAGPEPGTLSVEAWHERLPSGHRVDCEDGRTVCAVHVTGEGSRAAVLLPFGARSLGLAPTRLRVVPSVRLTAMQAAGLSREDLDAHGLVLGDGNTLSSARAGTRLLTSRPADPDCASPQVTCGVVFEVETTVRALGLKLF